MLPKCRFTAPPGLTEHWDLKATDDRYIEGQLRRVSQGRRQGLCNKYSVTYIEKGRAAANRGLRHYLDGVNGE